MVITLMPSSNILLPQTGILGYGGLALPTSAGKYFVIHCVFSLAHSLLTLWLFKDFEVIILGTINLQIITCSMLANGLKSQFEGEVI